ncbi:MAG: glutamine synthetase [Proteobacteria bacterium]|nr:glutamine synthetase [Pseudomonadota bacterium]
MNPTGADVEEATSFLDRHPDIEAIDIVLVDANGIGRGKMIRRHELVPLFRSGRHLPISILGLDVTGEDVQETGLVWSVGDADRIAWPVPGTLKPMPWTSPSRAQVQLALFELDGTPMAADPRQALQRQCSALKARGLTAAAAFELEFFLFDAKRGEDGIPRPAAALIDGKPSRYTQVYGLEKLDGMQPLFADIYQAAHAQDIPLETLISEYAPGQYELTLHYRNDIVQAADDLVCLKRLVRSVARRHQVTACFMAKPLADCAGSGMHLHVSLADAAGSNVFSAGAAAENQPLREAIGGLLRHMADSMLVFAPHANSWRRFVAQSYAPLSPTWGINNRSVAVRVPAGPDSSRRFEHRVSGVDANPYLVAATVLAGVQDGLANHLDPGAAVVGNGYESAAALAGTMPADWRGAIETAEQSGFLRSALGEGLHRSFIAVKRAEYLRVNRVVSELDYRLYLDQI